MTSRYFGFMTPVSTRAVHGLSTISDGTDTWQNSRVKHVAPCDISAPALSFRNFYDGDKFSGIGTITVKAAIEYNSLIYPVFFRGASSVAIEAGGGGVISDPSGIPVIPRGATYWVRTNVLVTSGQKWPHMLTTRSADGGGVEKGTGANTDHSGSGTIAASSSAAYTAEAVLCANPSVHGEPVTLPVIGSLGDSVMWGNGEDSPETDLGWFGRMINNNFANLRLERNGSSALLWVGSPTGTSGSTKRGALLSAITTLINGFGVNDLNGGQTLAQLQANTISIWRQAKSHGVKRVLQATLVPWTTSTDTWATVGNQTPQSWEADRVRFNNWIRDGAPITESADGSSLVPTDQPHALRAGDPGHPLHDYVEISDAVETARNSGRWKVGYVLTTDGNGVHPNPTGHAAIAASIDTSVFV